MSITLENILFSSTPISEWLHPNCLQPRSIMAPSLHFLSIETDIKTHFHLVHSRSSCAIPGGKAPRYNPMQLIPKVGGRIWALTYAEVWNIPAASDNPTLTCLIHNYRVNPMIAPSTLLISAPMMSGLRRSLTRALPQQNFWISPASTYCSSSFQRADGNTLKHSWCLYTWMGLTHTLFKYRPIKCVQYSLP